MAYIGRDVIPKELGDIANVDTDTKEPVNNDILKFNGTEWVPDAGSGSGIDADTLDGQEGSHYLDYDNFTNVDVNLGAETSGNYVESISGTANEIEVSGSGSESANVTIGLPDDVTVSNSLTVQNYATIQDTINMVSPDGLNQIVVRMLDGDTLTFSGESGQLFSITDNLTGTIFAVNDISGVPSIEVDDDGTIRFAESFGNVLIGTSSDDGANKLQVDGTSSFSSDVSIDGNLTVNGTTTTVNTTNTDVQDAVITLNSGQDTPSNDIGLLLQRYSSPDASNYNVGLAWDESADTLVIGKTPEDGNDNDLTFNTSWLTIDDSGNTTVLGDLDASNITINDGGTIGSVSDPDAITIDSSGNVGINNANPSSLIHVTRDSTGVIGAFDAAGNAELKLSRISPASQTGSSVLQVSAYGRLGLISDDFIKFNTGTLGSNIDERMRITSSGNVGIGTTSPATALDVNGTITSDGLDVGGNADISGITTITDDNVRFDLMESDATDLNGRLQNSGGVLQIRTLNDAKSSATVRITIDHATGNISFYEDTGSTQKLFWDANAEALGIGTTSPSEALDIEASSGTSAGISLNQTGSGGRDYRISSTGTGYGSAGNLAIYDATAALERLRIDSGGNVGIGTTSPATELDVNGDVTIADKIIHSGDTNTAIRFPDNDTVTVETAGNEALRVDSSGNVGIGTTSPNYKLEVDGSFAAQTKSFIINHPTKEGMKLQHGVSEAPEHSVFVRGRVTNNVIELPDYWSGLVYEDSITVQLTPFGRFQRVFVAEISGNKIILQNDNPLNKSIDCFYFIQAERKDVDRLEVEY